MQVTAVTPETRFWTEAIATEWDALVAAWPAGEIGDEGPARRLFGKMGDSDRAAAIRHAPDHLRDCKRSGGKPGSLRGYLRAELFKPWARGDKSHPRERVFVIAGTPAYDAWANRWRRENRMSERMQPFTVEREVDGVKRRGMLRDTLFPPKAQPCESAVATEAEARGQPPPGDDEGYIEITV